MTSTRRRLISAAAATAVAAGASLSGAAAAQADGDYYGTWTLATVKVGSEVQKCDGLPGEKDKCPAGMIMRLKQNYRYASTVKGFDIILMHGKGNFVTTTVPQTGSHAIVFNVDEYPTYLRAWKVTLHGGRHGAPHKMVLSGSFGENPEDPSDDETFRLVFHRTGK